MYDGMKEELLELPTKKKQCRGIRIFSVCKKKKK